MSSERTLILMRHAKSAWDVAGLNDFQRPLSARGKRDMITMGRWLNQQIEAPELVLCSAAQRTRQTAQGVLSAFGVDASEVEYRDDIYLASAQHLYSLVAETIDTVESLMVIGHNPGMEMLLTTFCPQVEPQHNGKIFTTANCAILSLDHTLQADLIALGRPKECLEAD